MLEKQRWFGSGVINGLKERVFTRGEGGFDSVCIASRNITWQEDGLILVIGHLQATIQGSLSSVQSV